MSPPAGDEHAGKIVGRGQDDCSDKGESLSRYLRLQANAPHALLASSAWLNLYSSKPRQVSASPLNPSHISPLRRLLEIRQDLFTLRTRALDVTNHVESTLRQVIALAVHDGLE